MTEKKSQQDKDVKANEEIVNESFFLSFNYVIDHASIPFSFYVNSLHGFLWFLLYYLLHLSSSNRFTALTILYPHKSFIWIYEFFKNHPRQRIFHNILLSNSENVSQKNLRTDRAREWNFRVSGGTNFEKFSTWCQPLWVWCVYRPIQKKLWIHKCIRIG